MSAPRTSVPSDTSAEPMNVLLIVLLHTGGHFKAPVELNGVSRCTRVSPGLGS